MDENAKDVYQALADEMDTVCNDTTSDAVGVLLASLKFQVLYCLMSSAQPIAGRWLTCGIHT